MKSTKKFGTDLIDMSDELSTIRVALERELDEIKYADGWESEAEELDKIITALEKAENSIFHGGMFAQEFLGWE